MRYSALASAVLAVSLSGAAVASPYSDMYVFGDSLFDTGNLGVRFTNRVGPDYQTSAYGPVSPSLAAQGLNLAVPGPSAEGGTNYAVGGNRTAQTLDSINAATTYQAPAGPVFNSLFYDLDRSGRSLDGRALYYLDGGGNDIPALVPVQESANHMVAAANALLARGANYVVIANVPDFGLSPAGILVQDYASGQAAAINELILQQVGPSNVLILNTFQLVGEVAADPAGYGINLSPEEFSYASFDPGDCATCTEGNPDAKIDGSNPDPDQFFFNDTRHPTTIGQEIAAGYVLSILAAPGEIALLPEMGLDDMQSHWRAAHPVMRSNRWDNSTETGKYTVWGGLSGAESERDTAYGDTGTNETGQYDLGFNYRYSPNAYLGILLSRADNQLDFDHSNSRYEMQSLDVSLLTGFRGERWFLEGALSYADLDYDKIQREFMLGPVLRRTEKGDTSGETFGALINGGYNLLGGDKYRFGPMLGYEYVNTEVAGYTEKGTSATALRVHDMQAITGIWDVGVFGDIQLGFCQCTLYSEAVYQSFDRDGSINPRLGLVTQPGNSAVLPGYERDDDGWRWDVGLSASLGQALELNISAGLDGADNSDGVWVGGQLSYVF